MSNYDFQVFTQLVPSGATISELRKQVQDYFDKNAIKVKFSNFDLSGAASGTTTKQINATRPMRCKRLSSLCKKSIRRGIK